MAENEKKYTVKNRSAGLVVYTLPEMGIRREFRPGEIKTLGYDELLSLSYKDGGRELMANYLMVQSEEALSKLEITAEPEYWMSEEQIKNLLVQGSIDEFLDALDFAPPGVLDLIKNYAIALPLTDLNKVEALRKKTGFNLIHYLDENRKKEENEEAQEQTETPTRRVTKAKEIAKKRRAESQSKIVEK